MGAVLYLPLVHSDHHSEQLLGPRLVWGKYCGKSPICLSASLTKEKSQAYV